MVKLHNTTQSVDNNLCEDAQLPTPVTIQKCETEDCPQWSVSDWKPCEESKCFTWNTGTHAGQNRYVDNYGIGSGSKKNIRIDDPLETTDTSSSANIRISTNHFEGLKPARRCG